MTINNHPPRPPGTPRAATVTVALLAGFLTACSGEEAPSTASGGVRPLVVVGVDSATWDSIDPLLEAGDLPNLRGLIERGLRTDLVCLPPLSSPVVWTTIATGTFGRIHNVLDHTYPYVPGPKRRVESRQRRVPAIWNLASHYRRSVGVVGYYASHPAEKVDGVMVTSKAPEGADGSVYPPEVEELVAKERERLRDPEERKRIWRYFLPWDFDPAAAKRDGDPYQRVTEVVQHRIVNRSLFDTFVQRVALALAPRRLDLFIIYLRMPDHASHATWLYYDDSEFEEKPDPGDRELLKDVIPQSYRYTDDFLGPLLEEIGPDANVVILSDHGAGPAVGEWDAGDELSGNHRPNGIFVAAGPDIRPGTVEGLTTTDVFPTLAALAGLPISDELPGAVFEEVFRDGYLRPDRPRRIESYGHVAWEFASTGANVDAEQEREALEQLKALGYLGGDADLADSTGEDEVSFWEIEPRLRYRALTGEVFYALMRDDLAAIDRLAELLRERDPKFLDRMAPQLNRFVRTWSNSFDFALVSDDTLKEFLARYGNAAVRQPAGDRPSGSE